MTEPVNNAINVLPVIYFLIKARFWSMCFCPKDTHFDRIKKPEEKRNTNKQTKASGCGNFSHGVGKNIDDPFVQMKTACKKHSTSVLCSKKPSFMLNICEASGVEVLPSVVVANTNSGSLWHHILKTWLKVVPSQRMPFFDLELIPTSQIIPNWLKDTDSYCI